MTETKLSEREKEIVLMGADGLADKEIARELGITHATVTTHWVRVRAKLGAKNRGHVIAKALNLIVQENRVELNQSAERFQILIDTLTDFAVFMVDRERRLTTWNPGVRRIFGYEEEEWLCLSFEEIFTREDRAAGIPVLEQELAEQKGRASDNRWHVRRDGSRFWASGVLVPIRNPDGTTVCYCKVLQNLTRLQRLEDQIRSLGAEPVK